MLELQAAPYTQNRELSWLRFNERVLQEAVDKTVPLLERLKFVAIFTTNLDEFFMIRVGSLHDLTILKRQAIDNKTGMTAQEQLDAIFEAVKPLIAEKDEIWLSLHKQLRKQGIFELTFDELDKNEQKYLKHLFHAEIDPVLSPQIVDSHHPFPHLVNKVLHVGARLKFNGSEVLGIIPLPASLPEIIFLPGPGLRYIRTDLLLLNFTDKIFQNYIVEEKMIFCVTRNADINPNDEAFELDEDFRNKMKKLLKERKKLAPVRLEVNGGISDQFLHQLCGRLQLSCEQVYFTLSPINMGYVYSLSDKIPPADLEKLVYTAFSPQFPAELSRRESVMRQVSKRDVLLSFPYESMDPFLQLLKEASTDSSVISIKITIYRLASRAKLVDYLCAAAENGKDVTVMIELRARFDEQNNIDWSQRLEEAGCRILYGFDFYKVHSKVCLITRKEHNGVSYITQVGTGNYNEKTAAQYTDLSYITSNPGIGRDANEFFKNLAIGNLTATYRHLLVSPHSMKIRLIDLIDREIEKGTNGYIFIKVNSVTDLELIDKLREASCAGVHIEMIVRGICCLLPQVENETENIRITSIVGRYLEHPRIYIFGRDADEELYISSADFMTRNMDRRVEVACPVYSAAARKKIHRLIQLELEDNTKARQMRSDGSYRTVTYGKTPIDAQQILMDDALESALSTTSVKSRLFSRLKRLLKKN